MVRKQISYSDRRPSNDALTLSVQKMLPWRVMSSDIMQQE